MKKRLLGKKYVVGVDEAGRGPLAGPLSVGFIMFSANKYEIYKKRLDSLPAGKDSKKLTARNRDKFYDQIKQLQKYGLLSAHVVFVENKIIDRIGLSLSIKRSIEKGLKKFAIKANETLVLLDGGLKAPSAYEQLTIIKGDEKETVIGLASIVAKVRRDRYMKKISLRYPEYEFHKHKGYGTFLHYLKIKKYGFCAIHRRSFLSGFVKKLDA